MFRDISTDFAFHPDTGNLLVKTGKAAVSQAIGNLLLSTRYDYCYRPQINANIRSKLFSPITKSTADELVELVKAVITNFEPRAGNISVRVEGDEFLERYVVALTYTINATGEQVSQAVSLKRVR